ncbi:tRNA (adenosine(37)-N6)-threonylcarbamoyltransferase complex ATPase subunit type 1 TsaE [Nocardioides mesophilus]|uniref:tRNA threonylcarbamoyladenosine biosynthesis protein TsaE n=1 Tax=Nocardioides mesophilus TaxID=433659 RepID=A0A7G9R780_9ACTN|nr:tRNA (adenosine(37)-N6)-threonylcarbamoyltransferase complex ATPase subunit type 1 TsaE [Nocardioides mesophilus]QNN51455.1 tRNA (adenosine(37)-N6)-threonylcarbamoyltransferase complex ATPase subunit type 1 TsaE [Nocardioides mesophilus]
MIEVAEVGPERAGDVVSVIHAGFGAREVLDPPSTATEETVQTVAAALTAHGGLLATADAVPVGALLFEPQGQLLGLRRVSVDPDEQGRGVARALVRRAERVAEERGFEGVLLTARAELPRTVRFWQHLGYAETGREGSLLTLARVLPVRVEAATAEQAQELGRRLAVVLRAGDLVILSGDLGAGKTTFTQGLGGGLDVRGSVTSPTFVISRVHPSLVGGPALVHVDAYRLGGIEELDDLDLDTSLEDAVTVVEWGEGVAEGLADTRLEVRITRARADDTAPVPDGPGPEGDGEEPRDPRTFTFVPVGSRWIGSGLRSALD